MRRYAAALSALILAVSFGFAACSSKEPQNDNGEVVIDKEGHSHIIMTNEKGQTVVDEKGSLVEVIIGNDDKPVTDSNGEPETSAVTFPDIVSDKDKIQIDAVEMPVPDGWKNKSTSYALFTHKKSGAVFSLKQTGVYPSLDDAVEQQNMLVESNTDGRVDIKVAELDLSGVKMYKRTMHNVDDGGYLIRYLFGYSGAVYIAECTVNEEYSEKIDFDAIMDTLTFLR